jgi:hypothetical protein
VSGGLQRQRLKPDARSPINPSCTPRSLRLRSVLFFHRSPELRGAAKSTANFDRFLLVVLHTTQMVPATRFVLLSNTAGNKHFASRHTLQRAATTARGLNRH